MTAAALRKRMETRIESLRVQAREAFMAASVELQELEVEVGTFADLLEIDLAVYDLLADDRVLTAEAVPDIDALLEQVLDGLDRQTAHGTDGSGREIRGWTAVGERYRVVSEHLTTGRQAAASARDLETAMMRRFGG